VNSVSKFIFQFNSIEWRIFYNQEDGIIWGGFLTDNQIALQRGEGNYRSL